MIMKQSDIQRSRMKSIKWHREYENASPELLAFWERQDKREQERLEQYLIEEAKEEARAELLAELQAEDFNVKFNSEIKIK